jgi:hypothetical protein
MTIMMGMDQHRAQITAEWLDTETALGGQDGVAVRGRGVAGSGSAGASR